MEYLIRKFTDTLVTGLHVVQTAYNKTLQKENQRKIRYVQVNQRLKSM